VARGMSLSDQECRLAVEQVVLPIAPPVKLLPRSPRWRLQAEERERLRPSQSEFRQW